MEARSDVECSDTRRSLSPDLIGRGGPRVVDGEVDIEETLLDVGGRVGVRLIWRGRTGGMNVPFCKFEGRRRAGSVEYVEGTRDIT